MQVAAVAADRGPVVGLRHDGEAAAAQRSGGVASAGDRFGVGPGERRAVHGHVCEVEPVEGGVAVARRFDDRLGAGVRRRDAFAGVPDPALGRVAEGEGVTAVTVGDHRGREAVAGVHRDAVVDRRRRVHLVPGRDHRGAAGAVGLHPGLLDGARAVAVAVDADPGCEQVVVRLAVGLGLDPRGADGGEGAVGDVAAPVAVLEAPHARAEPVRCRRPDRCGGRQQQCRDGHRTQGGPARCAVVPAHGTGLLCEGCETAGQGPRRRTAEATRSA